MKTSRLALHVGALAIVAALPLQSFASNSHFRNGQSIYGQPATVYAVPSKVVDVTSSTKVAARYGQTIAFRSSDGKLVTWTFNGLSNRAIALSRLAPNVFAGSSAVVFVGPDLQSRT